MRAGEFGDVVIFDAAKFQDHSTYQKPMQYASGVTDVFINGKLALKDGEPTGAHTGRVLPEDPERRFKAKFPRGW